MSSEFRRRLTSKNYKGGGTRWLKKSFTICLDILTQTTNGTDSPTCIVIRIAFTAFGHMLHGNNMRICTVLQDPITRTGEQHLQYT